MSLEETKARLLAASNTSEGLLAQIYDSYIQELESEEKLLAKALSELHNSGGIDLIKLVEGVDRNAFGDGFFTILLAFENALPSLNANVEDVLHCLVTLKRQADTGGLFGAFGRFCSMEPHRPRNSIDFIMTQNERDEYGLFLASSILAYDSEHVADAIQMTKNLRAIGNNTVRDQIYCTLGKLDVDDANAKVIWEILCNSASVERDDGCRATMLRSILYFGEGFPSYWSQIEDLLIVFVEEASPEVLHAISDILAFQRVELPNNIFHLMIKQLSNVSSEHNRTISNIDYVLVKLVKTHSSSLAVELLESTLALGVSIADLGYFSRELLSKHRDLLNHITTRWFLSGETSLCHSVLELLQTVTSKDIELKAELVLIDDDVRQVFASRKAVGWLFMRPIAAASFILSIYEVASTTSRKNLEEILYDPLLLSYPGELKRFLQLCVKQDVQEKLCGNLLEKLEDYHADIEKISGMKELMAPSENLSTYWKDANKEMESAYENASKFSILRDIATTQTLLYGNSSIYYLHQGDGTRVRQEMKMQSFSHSTEMPRLNVLDPESLDYTLRIFRYERMKDEVNS
ncbi:TPA: hypothetical protein ACPVXP_001573 [Vibrio parahaemolyticus]